MNNVLIYSFRKSALEESPQHWELKEDEMTLTIGNKSFPINIPYWSIKSLRFQAQPHYHFRDNNFCCEISCLHGTFQILSTHYLDFSKFEDRAISFNPFIQELFSRVKIKNPNCIIRTGQKPISFYGNIFLIFISFMFLYGVSFFLPLGGKIEAIIGIAGTAALYLQLSNRYNRPRVLQGNRLPEHLLPVIKE